MQYRYNTCHNKRFCHSSIPYGLSRILTSSQQGWRCLKRPIIQHRCPEYCMLPPITSGQTLSDLEWRTPVMTFVYNNHHSSMVAPVTRTIRSKVNHKNKPLTIRNNLYNSKPMDVIPHVSVYHVIRYNLIFTIFYMHVFHKLIIFIVLSLITHFHKNRVHGYQKYILCDL
jgi:hypothetical protein